MKRVFIVAAGIGMMCCACQNGPRTTFDYLGVGTQDVVKIGLTYQEEKSYLSINVEKESELWDVLEPYLNCALTKVDIPTQKFAADPLTVDIFANGIAEGKRFALSFMTTEGRTQRESTTYVLLEDAVYRMENQDCAMVYDPISGQHWRDPLYMFFYRQCILGLGTGSQGVSFSKAGEVTAPWICSTDYAVMPMEEILEKSEEIFVGAILGQKVYGDYAEADYDRAYYQQHEQHLSMPALTYTELEVCISESICGSLQAGQTASFTVPHGRDIPRCNSYELGISQRALQTGQTYVFFMQRLDCEVDRPLWVTDFCCGIMEVTGDGILKPLYNMDLEMQPEYCISLADLRQNLKEGEQK